MTYKLDSEKYKYNVSGHKESEFQGSPFPIGNKMNSQMVRSLAGCAMSKCKTFLEIEKRKPIRYNSEITNKQKTLT